MKGRGVMEGFKLRSEMSMPEYIYWLVKSSFRKRGVFYRKLFQKIKFSLWKMLFGSNFGVMD